MMLANESLETDDTPMPVFDAQKLGKRLRAGRYLAGFEKGEELAREMELRLGDKYSPATIYRVERGQQMPSLDLLFAMLLVLDPPGGIAFLEPGVADEAKEAWSRIICGS